MSFVGTRPEVVKYVKKYKPEYFATLLLPAGITSEASIKYKDEAELLDAAEDVDEVYNAEELSLYARRCRTYRKRKLAVQKLQSCMGESIEILEETLWNTIKVFSGYFFETSEGERFCYSVSGDEILISKSKESITRVDVNLAVEEILELNGVVESLQNMKVPGAGYLYPVFLRFGLIRRKGESDGHLSDMDNIQ